MVLQSLTNFMCIGVRHIVTGQQQCRGQYGFTEFSQQGIHHRVIGYAQTDCATFGMLQSFRQFTARCQYKDITARCCRFQQPELLVIYPRIRRQFRQVATHQRKMMAFIDTANRTDAFHRRLVADMATERVTGISRIDDDAAGADYLHSTLDQARLRVHRVYGKILRQNKGSFSAAD